VAAKFGEYIEKDKGGNYKQLHEFGIVYHPRSPYILGIMTRGNDFEKQAETIREISRLIYTEVGKTASKGG
jgi:hypothetical protein